MTYLNQTNGSLEVNAQVDNVEGGQTQGVSAEEKNNGGEEIDIFSGFPEKKEEDALSGFTKWDKDHFAKVIYMDEYRKEEFFERNPAFREKFEEMRQEVFEKNKSPEQKESEKVQKELQSLKYEKLIESKLSELGLTKNDLPDNVKIDFIRERNELIESGLSIEKATEKAFKLAGISSKDEMEKKVKLSAMGRPSIGGQSRTGDKKAPAFTPPQKISEWYS